MLGSACPRSAFTRAAASSPQLARRATNAAIPVTCCGGSPLSPQRNAWASAWGTSPANWRHCPRVVPRPRADWSRLARPWRALLGAKIAELEALQESLDGCIGCGCLSLQRCRLFNPDDEAAAEGPGSRWLREATGHQSSLTTRAAGALGEGRPICGDRTKRKWLKAKGCGGEAGELTTLRNRRGTGRALLLLPIPEPLGRWHLTSSVVLVVYLAVHVLRRRKRLRRSTIR